MAVKITKSRILRSPIWIAVGFYFVLGFILCQKTLNANFIYDDFINIDLNPFVQKLACMREIWRTNQARFLAYWSLAWNYSLGGMNPLGYHFLNTLLHIATGIIVYAFSARILETLDNALVFQYIRTCFREISDTSCLKGV